MAIITNITKTLEQKMIEDFEREAGECRGRLSKVHSNDEHVRYSSRLEVIEKSVKALRGGVNGQKYEFGGYSQDELERFDQATERANAIRTNRK